MTQYVSMLMCIVNIDTSWIFHVIPFNVLADIKILCRMLKCQLVYVSIILISIMAPCCHEIPGGDPHFSTACTCMYKFYTAMTSSLRNSTTTCKWIQLLAEVWLRLWLSKSVRLMPVRFHLHECVVCAHTHTHTQFTLRFDHSFCKSTSSYTHVITDRTACVLWHTQRFHTRGPRFDITASMVTI